MTKIGDVLFKCESPIVYDTKKGKYEKKSDKFEIILG